jgi:hypothetical protein
MSDTGAPAAAPVEAAPAAAAPAAAPQGGLLTGTPAPAAGTPAAPVSHFFGDHVAKEGVFNEGWAENLRTAGFERLANKAMLAKDESTLFKMLDDTIGFVGKKATGPTYPGPESTPEEIGAYRKAAGIPADPTGYTLKPAKLPEGMNWSDEDASAYAHVFHEHNIPQAAAQALVDAHLQTIARMSEEGQTKLNEQIGKFAQESEQTFQKEWGEQYGSRLEANRAFVQSRLSPEELADPVLKAALSHPAVVRMVDDARRGLREAPLPGVGAEAGTGSMSPRQQAFEIMRANPKWEKDPTLAKRVNDLYALEAAQQKRR